MSRVKALLVVVTPVHVSQVKALFISTVRTSEASIEHDLQFDTGFAGAHR